MRALIYLIITFIVLPFIVAGWISMASGGELSPMDIISTHRFWELSVIFWFISVFAIGHIAEEAQA